MKWIDANEALKLLYDGGDSSLVPSLAGRIEVVTQLMKEPEEDEVEECLKCRYAKCSEHDEWKREYVADFGVPLQGPLNDRLLELAAIADNNSPKVFPESADKSSGGQEDEQEGGTG